MIFTFIFAAHTHISKEFQNFIQSIESEKKELQGGAVAILYKGKVIYKTTFGHQKGNTNPIQDDTLFSLASVSKPISAMAIALLVDKKKLNLEQHVKIPCLKFPVNLKHVLSHTTGCPFPGNKQIEQGLTRQELLKFLKQQKTMSKPGKSYRYSNTIFSLAEEMLNAQNLNLKYAIKNLSTILNTNEIQILPLNSKTNIAYPHTHNLKKLPFPKYYPKTVPASAGVFASLNGMIKLFKLQFGYRPDLISKQTLNLFHTPYAMDDNVKEWVIKSWPCVLNDLESHYGLGVRIFKIQSHPHQELVCHSGYIAGVSTFVGFVPAKDIGIIILLNQHSNFAWRKGIEFWNTVLKNDF